MMPRLVFALLLLAGMGARAQDLESERPAEEKVVFELLEGAGPALAGCHFNEKAHLVCATDRVLAAAECQAVDAEGRFARVSTRFDGKSVECDVSFEDRKALSRLWRVYLGSQMGDVSVYRVESSTRAQRERAYRAEIAAQYHAPEPWFSLYSLGVGGGFRSQGARTLDGSLRLEGIWADPVGGYAEFSWHGQGADPAYSGEVGLELLFPLWDERLSNRLRVGAARDAHSFLSGQPFGENVLGLSSELSVWRGRLRPRLELSFRWPWLEQVRQSYEAGGGLAIRLAGNTFLDLEGGYFSHLFRTSAEAVDESGFRARLGVSWTRRFH